MWTTLRSMTKKTQRIKPIDIPFTERELLPNGTMFVTLKTLDELDVFWQENRHTFKFAAQGHTYASEYKNPVYLNDYEWVFGSSKEAVVETVCRWNDLNPPIQTVWYDWKNDSKNHIDVAGSFDWYHAIRDAEYQDLIKNNQLTAEDAFEFEQRLSRENYHGWWVLENLPMCPSFEEWFYELTDCQIINYNVGAVEATRQLKELKFDNWGDRFDTYDVKCHDLKGIEEEINYWKNERKTKQSYYGDENEGAPKI